MAGFLFSGCSKGDGDSSAKSTNTSSHPLTAPVDYIGAAGKAQKSAEKVVEAVGIKQAIGQFYAVEGRYPKDLNELVSENYLPSLPKAPAGKKIIYNPANGEVRIE